MPVYTFCIRHQLQPKPSFVWIGEKTFQLHKESHSFFGSYFGIFIAQKQRTFDNQGFITEVKIKIFTLINDCENDNGYRKNPSKVRSWLLASTIRFILYIANGFGSRGRSHRKILQFILSFMFGNSISNCIII